MRKKELRRRRGGGRKGKVEWRNKWRLGSVLNGARGKNDSKYIDSAAVKVYLTSSRHPTCCRNGCLGSQQCGT